MNINMLDGKTVKNDILNSINITCRNGKYYGVELICKNCIILSKFNFSDRVSKVLGIITDMLDLTSYQQEDKIIYSDIHNIPLRVIYERDKDVIGFANFMDDDKCILISDLINAVFNDD